MPLWAMSTSSKGGLDLSSTTIGEIMSLTGIVLLLFTFLIYPTLANYLGPHMSFLVGQAACAPLLLGLILVRSLPSYIPQIPMNIVNIMLVVDYVLFKITTNLCFSSICLVINQSVATNQRASVNGNTVTYVVLVYILCCIYLLCIKCMYVYIYSCYILCNLYSKCYVSYCILRMYTLYVKLYDTHIICPIYVIQA